MSDCITRYNSKKVTSLFNKSWKSLSNMIKKNGDLPKFAFRDFKKGFKKGFMKSCKLRSKSRKSTKITKKNKK